MQQRFNSLSFQPCFIDILANFRILQIFLTAALHDSVMLVLCQDEVFLDIDPAKVRVDGFIRRSYL